MYTRSYYPEDGEIKIPEKYDGNAFREEVNEERGEEASENQPKEPQVLRAPWDGGETAEEVMAKSDGARWGFGGFLDKLPFKGITDALPFFKGGNFHLGNEEILILAIALFLFFSRGGDKECAVMLLLLLWIK